MIFNSSTTLYLLIAIPPAAVISVSLYIFSHRKNLRLKKKRILRWLPIFGVLIAVIGSLLNMFVVLFNNGKMPVAENIINRVSPLIMPSLVDGLLKSHSLLTSASRLPLLADIFGNGASIGDCLITTGTFILAIAWVWFWIRLLSKWKHRRMIKSYGALGVILPVAVFLFLMTTFNFVMLNFVLKL